MLTDIIDLGKPQGLSLASRVFKTSRREVALSRSHISTLVPACNITASIIFSSLDPPELAYGSVAK